MNSVYSKYDISLVGELLFHSWGDQGIIFHVESGDTHLLNDFTFQVLSVVNEHPRIKYESLLYALESQFFNDDGDFKEQFLEVLVKLQKMNLLQLQEQ